MSVANRLIEEYRDTQRAAARAAIPAKALPPADGYVDSRAIHIGHRDRLVYFISQVLKTYEENYTILELEMALLCGPS